ncbi:serine/threonine-protein kinase par-1-like [Branchiostoma lanceolatum]|uniref:serine/threonine-protein kinase par-1-like n=1 Tax=Branchiostoma lanceolatum TaxID=7740 RepID=UPI0034559105
MALSTRYFVNSDVRYLHAKKRVWRSSYSFEDWLFFRSKFHLDVKKSAGQNNQVRTWTSMKQFTKWLFTTDKGEDVRFVANVFVQKTAAKSAEDFEWPGGDGASRPQSPVVPYTDAVQSDTRDAYPAPDLPHLPEETYDTSSTVSSSPTSEADDTSSTLPSSVASETDDTISTASSSLTTVTQLSAGSVSSWTVSSITNPSSSSAGTETLTDPTLPVKKTGIPRWMLCDLQAAAEQRGYRINLVEGYMKGGYGCVLFGDITAKRLVRHKQVMDAAIHNGHSKVAYKLMQHSFVVEGKTVRDQYQWSAIKSELQVLNRTRVKPHPNLLNLYDTWVNNHIAILVCPKAESVDLSYYIAEQKPCVCLPQLDCSCTSGLPESVARALFSQIINGLKYLHGRGIYHRDLKTENVLLDRFYKVKICDFGLAIKYRRPLGHFKICRDRVGTHPNICPEALRGHRYSPKQADLFAMGTLLHHLTVGRRFYNVPCHETDNAQTKAIFKQMHRWRGRPPISQEFVSSELAKLIYALTNEEGNRRPKLKAVRKSSWLLDKETTPPYLMDVVCAAHCRKVLTIKLGKVKDPEKLQRIRQLLTSMGTGEKPLKGGASEKEGDTDNIEDGHSRTHAGSSNHHL